MFLRFVFLFLLFSCEAFSQEIYKYKDENGKWVYTDKRPLNLKEDEFESVEYEWDEGPIKPRVYVRSSNNQYSIVADNPFYAPVEFLVESTDFKGGSKKFVVSAASKKTLFTHKAKVGEFRYRWVLGDPKASENGYLYKIPVSSKFSHKITQSFHGKFSHSKQPSLYAVDIAVTVGTDISAARGGVVIWVKDDYHMGGNNKYFLDKANYVNVLHEDGTYATYAHILMGTTRVKAGDTVNAGDVLARSGSSGYSTGPHLHFVIRKNIGLETGSIPFQFISHEGTGFTPKRGMLVDALGKGT